MSKDTGYPAFPCENIIERDANGHLIGHEISGAGLSIRDYFAAKAMQSQMAGRGEFTDSNNRRFRS